VLRGIEAIPPGQIPVLEGESYYLVKDGWKIRVMWEFREDQDAMDSRLGLYNWNLTAPQQAALTYVMALRHSRGNALFPNKMGATDREVDEVLQAVRDLQSFSVCDLCLCFRQICLTRRRQNSM